MLNIIIDMMLNQDLGIYFLQTYFDSYNNNNTNKAST